MQHLPKVKICGMRCADDVETAVSCGADAVGFITEVPVDSPRKIDVNTAAHLVRQVPLFVSSVLVIMPSDGHEALELIEDVRPDAVQLHNELGPEDLDIIRSGCNCRVIRYFAVPVDEESTADRLVREINELADNDLVDAVLLDSGKAGMSGGTGLTHNWSVSREVVENTDLPVILAGGLRPENVRAAVEKVRPYGVDTASGVETGGKKDHVKVCGFVREARCVNG